MSGYKTHITFGVLLSLILYASLVYFGIVKMSIEGIILVILISSIYSILPDIDIRTSKAFKLFLTISMILITYLAIKGEIIYILVMSLLILMVVSLKHRGITHRSWFGLIVSLPLFLISFEYFLVGLLSYLSHLMLDNI